MRYIIANLIYYIYSPFMTRKGKPPIHDGSPTGPQVNGFIGPLRGDYRSGSNNSGWRNELFTMGRFGGWGIMTRLRTVNGSFIVTYFTVLKY